MKSLNYYTASRAHNLKSEAHASVTKLLTPSLCASSSKSGSTPTPLPTPLAAIDRLLRLPDVLAKFPVGRSTWYAGMRTGRYPKPVRISQRAVGWSCAAIDALIARQVAQVCSAPGAWPH